MDEYSLEGKLHKLFQWLFALPTSQPNDLQIKINSSKYLCYTQQNRNNAFSSQTVCPLGIVSTSLKTALSNLFQHTFSTCLSHIAPSASHLCSTKPLKGAISSR